MALLKQDRCDALLVVNVFELADLQRICEARQLVIDLPGFILGSLEHHGYCAKSF